MHELKKPQAPAAKSLLMAHMDCTRTSSRPPLLSRRATKDALLYAGTDGDGRKRTLPRVAGERHCNALQRAPHVCQRTTVSRRDAGQYSTSMLQERMSGSGRHCAPGFAR